MSRAIVFEASACDSSEIRRARSGSARGADHAGVGPQAEIPAERAEEPVFTPEDLDAQRTYLLKVANRILKPELRPRVSPSDLVQESVVIAIRKFRSFHGRSLGQLRSWLTGILRNRYGKHYRDHYGPAGRRKPRVVSVEALRTESHGWEIPAPGISDSAERKREQLEKLLAELGRLSAAEAEVFLMVIDQKIPMSEIARRLGISEASARKRHTRALDRLRKCLNPEREGFACESQT